MPPSAVPRCELAPGFTISRVVTGLWQVADMERSLELDLEAAAAAMAPYVEAGLTTFDMADHYGSAEEIAGIFRRRHDAGGVQLLSKWVPKPGPITREDVRAAVRRSLDRLQAESVDLLQFHAWNYADPSWLDGLFCLQELREEGLVRHLGLTNVDTAHLRIVLASGIDVVSNQVCFSLLDQRAARCNDERRRVRHFDALLSHRRDNNRDDEEQNEQLDELQQKYQRAPDEPQESHAETSA